MRGDRRSGTAYSRIETLLSHGECVILDGGLASEIALGDDGDATVETGRPDTWAIYDRPGRVVEVHRDYAAAGCDVISTNTWGILGSIGSERGRRPGRTGLPAWTVAARDAVQLARSGIAEAGRTGSCAVAFCLNDADPLLAGEQTLLSLLWSAEPPDLVLIETLVDLPSRSLRRAISEVTASGIPVWVSFQRSGPPDDEAPGELAAAAADLERAGVRALLVNCVPAEVISAAVAELFEATALPVGCYPRLDGPLDPTAYAALSLQWRAAGASIVGGCCGVGPAHVHAAREFLTHSAGTRL